MRQYRGYQIVQQGVWFYIEQDGKRVPSFFGRDEFAAIIKIDDLRRNQSSAAHMHRRMSY